MNLIKNIIPFLSWIEARSIGFMLLSMHRLIWLISSLILLGENLVPNYASIVRELCDVT